MRKSIAVVLLTVLTTSAFATNGSVGLFSFKFAADADTPAVIENPRGEQMLANYASLSCTNSLFGIQVQQLSGPTDVVWNRDAGKVYIKNIVAGLSNGYVEGALSNDGKTVSVSLPQVVAYAVPEGTQDRYPIYVSVMHRVDDMDGDAFISEADAAKNVAVYAVSDRQELTLVSPVTEAVETAPSGLPIFPYEYITTFIRAPKSLFGTLAPGEEDTDIDMWYGVGTFMQTISPLPADLVYNTVPDNLTWNDSWRIVSTTGDGQMCSVAIDDNDFYVRHLADELPDAVIKGTLKDGKVTFPNKQFMGVAEKYGSNYLYFLGADYDFEYDDYFGSMTRYTINGQDVVMDWDAEKQTLTETADGKGFIINGSLDSIYLFKGFAKPVIAIQTQEDLDANPLPPTVEAYIPGSGDFAGFVKITYHLTNVNQAILDPSRLSYSLYVNGEKLTFTPSLYGVADATEEIPFTYTDLINGSIYSTSMGAMIDIYQDDVKTLGAQAIYLAPDGTKYYSTIDTLEIAALQTVAADCDVLAARYFDLQGRPVATPVPGSLAIKVETLTDGTTRVTKEVK